MGKETVQECVSEFISFITSEASDKCLQEKRKTINGDDLLWAMSTLGFDKYVEPLKLYLSKYREAVRGDKPDKASARAGGVSEQPKILKKKGLYKCTEEMDCIGVMRMRGDPHARAILSFFTSEHQEEETLLL